MIRSFRKISFLVVLSAAPLFAQSTTTPTWFPIAGENPNISVTLPAGTTYRWGTASCPVANNAATWTQVTVAQTTTIGPLTMAGSTASFGFADPCLGTAKELDVLETASVQSLSLTNSTATPATVAMIVPSSAPTTVVNAAPGSNHTLTFTNFSVAPGSTQNALMFACVNQNWRTTPTTPGRAHR